MRGFIYGTLIASVFWVFFSLGGNAKVRQTWANYQQAEALATVEQLKDEREKAFASNFRPSPGCANPRSELRRIECNNQADMSRSSFYAQWNRANANRIPK